MTISADWRWWTYFLIGSHVVSHGQILAYDIGTKSLTYLRWNGNDPKQNPHQLGTPEFSSWCWDTVTGPYDKLWVDPSKAIVLAREDFELLQMGQRPDGFVEVEDIDPQEFFAGEEKLISTYLRRRA